MAIGSERLADSYQPAFGIPYRPVLPRAELEKWDEERLREYVRIRKEVEQRAIDNPVGAGWVIPMWELVMENWKNYQNIVILGGNRCLRGDSLIYDPVLKVCRRIDSIKGKHRVNAWDGEKVVIAEAEEPFAKAPGPMVRVRLSTGQTFVAALEHRVLSSDGDWRQLSELRPGHALFLPRSNWGIFQQDQPLGAPHCSQKASDSQDGYRSSPRLCDEQLPWDQDSDQGVSPSQGDAPTHTCFCDSNRHSPSSFASHSRQCTLDDRDNTPSRNHAWLKSPPRSIRGGLRQLAGRFAGTVSRAFCTPCKQVSRLFSGLGSQERRQSIAESDPRSQSSGEFFQQATQCSVGLAYIVEMTWAGIEVKWDMTVPAHGNYIQSGIVHHNSSKSMIASRLCVWGAATIPEAEVRCYHVNEDRSISDQQGMVYDALPLGIKNLNTKKGMNHSLAWSQKNGFTDNVCILPPLAGYRKGGVIRFGNYRQYQQDAQVAEGFKSHINWFDEECPQKFWETMQYRTVDYHGRNILTFTTLTGWSPLIQDILGKTKTLKTRFAPLVGYDLPVMQESLSRPGTVIYYFWTEDNPFIDTSDFVAKIKGRPKEEILARAYGVPTKSVASVFPSFNKEINVIKHEDLPWLKKKPDGNPVKYPVTRYMAIDPAGSKNWFAAWVAVDPAGTWWVYREYPDDDDWALPGNTVEGKPGPASRGRGFGIKDYVELFTSLEKENGEEIFERYIDPRMGAAERQSQDGATTIISDLDDAGMTVIPAPGVDIENGLQMINTLLAWDETKPRDSLNSPRLYVSDRCQNIIYALSEYTAKGGSTEASKDPADACRYLAVSNIQYIDAERYKSVDSWGKTGSY